MADASASESASVSEYDSGVEYADEHKASAAVKHGVVRESEAFIQITDGDKRRPIHIAALWFADNILTPAIGKAITFIGRKGKEKASVRLGDYWRTRTITVRDVSGKDHQFPFHSLMYGPQMAGGTAFDRDQTVFYKNGFCGPIFRQKQVELMEREDGKKLYMIDESDPSKGNGTFISIYRLPQPASEEKLWHGFDRVPKAHEYINLKTGAWLPSKAKAPAEKAKPVEEVAPRGGAGAMPEPPVAPVATSMIRLPTGHLVTTEQYHAMTHQFAMMQAVLSGAVVI